MNEPKTEETIFAATLQLPPAERAAYLHQACGEDVALRRRIEVLLNASEQAGAFLEAAAVPKLRQAGVASIPLAEKPGDRIGRYKLLQQIGEGGCGVVYMAEQEEPVHRRVALKVIKLGMDTKQVIARFEAERQALAVMDHPNIAKVLDAGATETGRPYFVMELVRGIKITEYCDQNNLSTRERLDLFVQVCRAIQHAHQKGVIHRDVKPANILVTLHDGVPVPKVIDFGIAKATQGRLTDRTVFTAFEQFIGTPAYMSPEQAEMSGLDIDTRSDIYSLGVLLYELLTGQTPFDTKELLAEGLDAMRRTIREKEPERPSTRLSTMLEGELSATALHRHSEAPKLITAIRGDLDWIVMKCLEKDRTRRYETANGLASEIQRHLNQEPVLACPPSRLYRFQKMVRRNKLVFGAGSVVAFALFLGLGASVWQAVRATRAERNANAARANANEEAAVARAVSDFLENDLLRQAGSVEQAERGFQPQPDLTVKEALRRAADKVGERFTNQPAIEAEIRRTLGIAFNRLGEWKLAIPHLERAVALYQQTAGRDAPQTLEGMRHLAEAYSGAGRFAEAVSLSEETLKLTKAKLGAEHSDTLASMERLAVDYGEAGRYPEKVALCEQVLRLSKAKFGIRGPETLARMNDLALAYHFSGRFEESLALQEETVKLAKSVLGPEHPNTLIGVRSLAMAYGEAGRWGEALPLQEETLKLTRAKLGADHPNTLRGMTLLAMVYMNAGHMDQALPLQEETLKLVKARLGPDHPDTLINMNNLAAIYSSVGRMDEAISLLEQVLKLGKVQFGPDHPAVLTHMNNLALAYRDAGRLTNALPLLEETSKLLHSKLGLEHPFTIANLDGLLGAYQAAGRHTDAARVLAETLGPAITNHPQNPAFLRVRANYYARCGRWKEAAADLARTIELKPDDAADWLGLAALLVQAGELEQYREHCRKALERFAKATDPVTTFRIAKDCLILASSGANLELVGRMADHSLLIGTNSSRWAITASAKALAEYRQGRWASAVDWAERALLFRPAVPCPCWPPCAQAEAEAVLAMGHEKLGQKNLALAALVRGAEIVKNLPGVESGNLGKDWLGWIIAHALIREAQALIEGGPESKTETK